MATRSQAEDQRQKGESVGTEAFPRKQGESGQRSAGAREATEAPRQCGLSRAGI